MAFELYRHFENDTLLYVGSSLSSVARLAAHRHVSHWFDRITTIKIERLDTHANLLIAENLAIINEKPLFNKKRVIAQKVVKKGSRAGRPRLENRDKTLEFTKPWVNAGISRASWFRRQKEL